MRAQVLKNAVIVPTGAKGGLRAARRRGRLDRRRADGVRSRAAYDAFVGALLDVTDDLDGDAVVPVPGPAGTATTRTSSWRPTRARPRSPTVANAHRRWPAGFWLGDAFASGGSTATTTRRSASPPGARGSRSPATSGARRRRARPTPITVAGVGDMSGDVFGNGMLLLRPAPASWPPSTTATSSSTPTPTRQAVLRRAAPAARAARARRGSDYDRTLISDGGGVLSRTRQADRARPPARPRRACASTPRR